MVPELKVGLSVAELIDKFVSWGVVAWATGVLKVTPEIKSIGSMSEEIKTFLINLPFTRLLRTVSEIRDATYLGESSRSTSLAPLHFCGYPKDYRLRLQIDLDFRLWLNLEDSYSSKMSRWLLRYSKRL